MNEWIKDFNVIYNGELYKNCVYIFCYTNDVNSKPVISDIEIIYINENGELKMIRDKAECFKFVRK